MENGWGPSKERERQEKERKGRRPQGKTDFAAGFVASLRAQGNQQPQRGGDLYGMKLF